MQTQYLLQMQPKAATLDAGQLLEAAVNRLGTGDGALATTALQLTGLMGFSAFWYCIKSYSFNSSPFPPETVNRRRDPIGSAQPLQSDRLPLHPPSPKIPHPPGGVLKRPQMPLSLALASNEC